MKEYHYYECETCLAEYDSEEKANACEGTHLNPVNIVSQKNRYKPFENYPYEVTITFDDGTSQVYIIKKDGWY